MERYQKVALLGGVYNNYLALDQLRGVCERHSVDTVFSLGDVGGFGPYPDRSFPLLRDGTIHSIAGNYDISLAEGRTDCGCGYTDPRDNHFAQISYDYTFEHTSPENKAWLGTLPHSHRFDLGSLRVVLCHGSPRKTNEFLWNSTSPDHLLRKFLTDNDADIICCTHTGAKWYRDLGGGKHFINVGVIGRPENDGSQRVWFCTLEYRQGKLACEFHPIEYDYQRLADEMKEEKLPDEFIETVMTGWWTTCLEVMPTKERRRGRF